MGLLSSPGKEHRKRLCSISYKYDIYWLVSDKALNEVTYPLKKSMRFKITFSFAVFSECTLKTVPILGILSDALTGKVSNDHYLVIFQENEKKRYDDSIVSYYLFICLVFTLKFIVIINET